MKQQVSFILAVFMLAGILTGCKLNDETKSSGSDDRLSVIATIFAPYDFVREITGDLADITMLLPPASEIHSYEPSAQDIIKIQKCDVFIYVGGESDNWADKLLASMDTGEMKIITLMDCVDIVEEEIIEGMEGSAEDEEEAYDEHVWTSPKNAKLIVQKISNALCEADMANADTYQANTAAYLEKLDELDDAFQSVVENAVRKTIVFGDRFPFRYLADAYGLEYYAAFPGCSAESEASAGTITFLIDKVKEENIPVIFHVELSNKRMAETISEDSGAKVMLLHACHNISKSDFENGVSYLDLMRQNVENLREALQ